MFVKGRRFEVKKAGRPGLVVAHAPYVASEAHDDGGVTKRGSRETQILQVTNPDIDGIAKMVQKGRPL